MKKSSHQPSCRSYVIEDLSNVFGGNNDPIPGIDIIVEKCPDECDGSCETCFPISNSEPTVRR